MTKAPTCFSILSVSSLISDLFDSPRREISFFVQDYDENEFIPSTVARDRKFLPPQCAYLPP